MDVGVSLFREVEVVVLRQVSTSAENRQGCPNSLSDLRLPFAPQHMNYTYLCTVYIIHRFGGSAVEDDGVSATNRNQLKLAALMAVSIQVLSTF